MTKDITIKNNGQLTLVSLVKLINTLSLDVVIGSLFSGFLVVKLFSVEPGWAFWVVLPVSVWIIYTLDHLIDAYRLKSNAHTYRHNFHYLHFRKMLLIILILSILDLGVIFAFLEQEIVNFGLLSITITAIYLLLVHLIRNNQFIFSKEIMVAIIYTIGIWGGPISLNHYLINTDQCILLVTFFLLVLADILLLSLYEYGSDLKDNHLTLAVKYGKPITTKIIFSLLAIIFALGIYILFSQNIFLFRVIAKLFLMMGLLEAIIFSFPDLLKKKNLYRYFIEWTFWIPGLLILL